MNLPPLSALLLLLLPTLSVAQSTADEQYRYLAGLVDKGMHELATEEARSFLKAHPRHEKAALARYRLAGSLWALELRSEAVREYETLARTEGFEYRAECLFRCGEAAQLRGDTDRARKAFDGVLAAGQDYLVAPALFALGELHFRAGHFDLAEPHYGRLLEAKPDSPEAPLARRALAWCAWERGDAELTIQRTRTYLKDERDGDRKDDLFLLLGEALLATDPEGALKTFRKIDSPERLEARLRGEGFALSALGDHGAAAKAFDELLAKAPEGRFAREAALQGGIELLRSGDAQGAVERLRAAGRNGDTETLYWLAQAQNQAERPREALASLAQALEGRPSRELEARIHVLRGDCLTADGRGNEALGAYEASGSDQALYAGAVVALNEGDAAAAARLAEGVLRTGGKGPRAQGARVVLAEAHFAAERYEEAEAAFEQALEHSSEPAERVRLASRIAWCPYLRGDLPGASKRFTRLAKQAPKSPEGEEALAMCMRISLELGHAEEGRSQAERYLQRHPDGRFADQALLALARTTEGKTSRAHFRTWLERFPSHPQRPSVLLELANLESEAGAHADAERRFAEVQELAPGTRESAQATYGQAWSAWERKDYAACESLLVSLLQADDLDPGLGEPALELLIWARVEQGQLEAGVAAWRQLSQRKGDEKRRFESARRLLTALREAKEVEAADALLEECLGTLRSSPLVAAAWLEGAYLDLERSDSARAEVRLAKAHKAGAQEAGLAEATYHVAEARLGEGDVPRALTLFERASSKEHPRAGDALYKLGFLRLSRGELEPAAEALQALLQRHPESQLATEALFLLGECAYRSGDFATAAERFLAVRKEAVGELLAKTLFRAGLTLGQESRWPECATVLSELARSFPEFPNLAEGELWRGRALSALDKGRHARAAFERTLALDKGELAAGARLGLGRLDENEGRLDDALSQYLKVALLFEHGDSVSEALFASGRVLEAQGESTQALARYRELVAEYPDSPLAAQARQRLRSLEAPSAGARGR